MDNKTNVTWTLEGTMTNATANSTAGPGPSSGTTASSALPNVVKVMVNWAGAVTATFLYLIMSLL
jgi:hypothetical protein